jgi:hypothetical protein
VFVGNCTRPEESYEFIGDFPDGVGRWTTVQRGVLDCVITYVTGDYEEPDVKRLITLPFRIVTWPFRAFWRALHETPEQYAARQERLAELQAEMMRLTGPRCSNCGARDFRQVGKPRDAGTNLHPNHSHYGRIVARFACNQCETRTTLILR